MTCTEVTIDEELYSRQIYVLGLDAMRHMSESKILIAGLGGLGVEVAKNLVLGGVGQVVLQDIQLCTNRDLSSQFFLTNSDIGKNRASQSLSKVQELNPHVQVSSFEGPLTKKYISEEGFSVVVLTEGGQSANNFEEILEHCHNSGIRVILAETRGLFARIFVDFGDDFVVTDPDGQDPTSVFIEEITNDKQAVVGTLKGKPHGFSNDDFVVFEEVEGMTEINLREPARIRVVSPTTFRVDIDTSEYTPYSGGGKATTVKLSKRLHFKSYQSSRRDPQILESDFGKLDHSGSLNLGFQALDSFFRRHLRLPRPWNFEDAEEVLNEAESISGDKIENCRLIRILSYTAQGQLSPVNGFIGGLVAQEVMKACSGKFHPIFQWFIYDALECLPNTLLRYIDDGGKLLKGFDVFDYLEESRYSGQVILLGKELQEKLSKLNCFVVGAGAIGCELLKNLAMMGTSTAPNSALHITDMDHIERSNLNRQFLFRQHDIGQPKSKVGASAAIRMNPELKIKHHQNPVGPDTRHVYNIPFFESLDCVFSAVDNFQARVYLDKMCTLHRLPLLDSGTMGTMGSTQVMIPDTTASYGKPPSRSDNLVPSCTLKHFPYEIEHTIQWARDLFEGTFTNAAAHAQKFINDPEFIQKFSKLPEGERNEILTSLQNCFGETSMPKNFEDCVRWARLLWEEHFNNGIKQLLSHFPPHKVTFTGERFWSGQKKCPRPLAWENETWAHRFIFYAANFRATMFDIGTDEMKFKGVINMASDVKVDPFVPKKNVIEIDANGDEIEIGSKKSFKNSDIMLRETLENIYKNELKIPVPLKFEKDDDSNMHIDFIQAAANCRALNYGIPPADRLKTKLIAGKIAPAIATTTSVVASLVCLELLKIVGGQKKLQDYKTAHINLAVPMIHFSQPRPPPRQSHNGSEWTVWDRLEVNGRSSLEEMTLRQFLEHFRINYDLQIRMLIYNELTIFRTRMSTARKEERLCMPVTQLVLSLLNEPSCDNDPVFVFEMTCTDNKGENVQVPPVWYKG